MFCREKPIPASDSPENIRIFVFIASLYLNGKLKTMKTGYRYVWLMAMWLVSLPVQGQKAATQEGRDTRSHAQTLEWFRDAKFGLFIHWGLYSQAAGEWNGKPAQGGEHFMIYEKVPLKEYATLADQFNPTGFDAEAWVKTAKAGGMKYLVITTKHHEGFAMYDSKTSDYNIVKRTPFKRDPMKELAEACHRHSIGLGFYYSLGRDWEDPDVPTNWPTKGGRSNITDYPDEDAKNLQAYVDRKAIPQLRELLTQYGPVAMIWFDTPELINREQALEIKQLVNTLQPGCLINGRLSARRVGVRGDYNIEEQRLIDSISAEPWETCLTMGSNWGYNKFDQGYRAPEIFIRHLADIVSKNGNLLLNVGPTGQGTFPEQTAPIFAGLHAWLKANGEAIYDTHPWYTYGESFENITSNEVVNKEFHDAVYDGTPKDRTPDFRFTTKDGTVYVIARDVYAKRYTIGSFGKVDRIRKVTLLDSGKKVLWKRTSQGLEIDLGKAGEQTPIYVLKVEL